MPWPIGQTATELLGEPNPRWTQLYGQALDTGRPIRVEEAEPTLDRVFDLNIFTLDRDRNRVAVLFTNITERKRAEAALRASEERQAFLLELSDALRTLMDADEIQRVAARLAAGHWGMAGANYVRIEPRHGVPYAIVRQSYVSEGREPINGDYPLVDFPGFAGKMVSGEALIVPEVASDPNLTELDKANWKAMDLATLLSVPLVKSGRLVACFAVHGPRPKAWTVADAQLLAEIAERTWAAVERTGAEAALRESERRFRQFAAASASALWIRDASTLHMEYVSPAIARIYGVEPAVFLDGVELWAASILPEDRDVALEHLERARQGETVVHEFRIQRPSDMAFRWIRDTDFPLHDEQGRIQRIGGIAEDVTEAKLAVEHQTVLLAELQHRVRNIMALLRSITDRTAERAESVPAYRDVMMGRLLAFARVQALLTRAGNVSVGMASIVHDEVSVQAQHEGQYDLAGPDIELSPKAAEVLTLAIHELATNAVKYGALAAPDGKVSIRWSTFEKRGSSWLSFDWTEQGAPKRPRTTENAPRRRGFGSELIEGRIPYELKGRGSLAIEPGGARCHLEFPLQEGASILETGAPRSGTVFGGAIDMTGEPDLTGRRVLVVEDDFYLAMDAARALRGAGAEVMGPCATEADARAELEEQRPDAAVVDINLGPGPSFKLAETLKDRDIPFVFTTGYDAKVIPAEFEDVERLEKPLQLRQIVGAVSQLMAPAP